MLAWDITKACPVKGPTVPKCVKSGGVACMCAVRARWEVSCMACYGGMVGRLTTQLLEMDDVSDAYRNDMLGRQI